MTFNYTWQEMLWIILLYSCLGWCVEVAYAALKRGVFVNRGFLNGPVCPIYGFGVLGVVLVLEPVKDNLALLFFGSMLYTSAIEFIAGFAMERFFHDRWWDYRECPFNIGGYVCLEFSIIWGLACVLVVDVFHPILFGMIALIPQPLYTWLMWILLVVMAADMVITLVELLRLPRKLRAMEELEKALTLVSDTMGEKVFETVERGVERKESFDEKHPEEAERMRERLEIVMTKRTEINTELRQMQDARRAELEAKLTALRKPGFVHRRIAKAYPKLAEGRNFGRHFRNILNGSKDGTEK